MSTLFVSSEALGTEYSLRISGRSLRKVEGDPLPEEFVLGDPRVRTLGVEDVFPIFGHEVPMLVSEAMRKSHTTVRPGQAVNWQLALGNSRFVRALKRVSVDCERAIDEILEEKYLPQLKVTRDILTKLQPALVDSDALRSLMSGGGNAFIESFRPRAGDECHPVRYSHDTATGRLIVSSGPKILNLNKEHRRILRSRFRKGAIGIIDYVSLEPRTALLLTRDEAPRDIYEAMRAEIGSQHTRGQLKVATISALYGQRSESSIPASVIGRFFRVPQIHERHLGGWDLCNLYGRKLEVDEERLRLPYFVQSTAVDVALTGFSSILSRFAEMVPLFVIHDAIVVDAERDLLDELAKTGLEVDVAPLGKFYLSVKLLDEENS